MISFRIHKNRPGKKQTAVFCGFKILSRTKYEWEFLDDQAINLIEMLKVPEYYQKETNSELRMTNRRFN